MMQFGTLLAATTHRPHACDLSGNDGGSFLLGLRQATRIQKMFDQNTAAWGLGVESASGIKKAMKTQAIFCDTVATDGSSWSLTPEAELNPRNKPTLADELRSNSRIWCFETMHRVATLASVAHNLRTSNRQRRRLVWCIVYREMYCGCNALRAGVLCVLFRSLPLSLSRCTPHTAQNRPLFSVTCERIRDPVRPSSSLVITQLAFAIV